MLSPMAVLVPADIEYRMMLIGPTTIDQVFNQTSSQAQYFFQDLLSVFTSTSLPSAPELPLLRDTAALVLYGLSGGVAFLPMLVLLSIAFTLG